MSPEELALMAAAEEGHWWYLGLRDLLARQLVGSLQLREGARVLDAGCGTGANLRLLHELLRPGYLGGFDLAPEAVESARRKAPTADVYRSDLRAPELHADRLDCILSLDAIYIPGLAACMAGLGALTAALRPGGLLLLHLPAFDWLRSEHDVAVRTGERFTRERVRRALDELGLEPLVLTYRVFWLFPAIVAARLPGMLAARAGRLARVGARSDLRHAAHPALGRLLLATLRAENRWIAAGKRFPWGSSLFAVGKKPERS